MHAQESCIEHDVIKSITCTPIPETFISNCGFMESDTFVLIKELWICFYVGHAALEL
jgi:hypothetical protein